VVGRIIAGDELSSPDGSHLYALTQGGVVVTGPWPYTMWGASVALLPDRLILSRFGPGFESEASSIRIRIAADLAPTTEDRKH
jgi:hypothetical protein